MVLIMACLRPFRLKTGQIAPCGHCSECRRRLANEWSYRLQKMQNNSCLTLFVTLTYGDCFLPVNSALFSNNGICFTNLRKDKIFVGDPRTMEVSVVNRERYNNALYSDKQLSKCPISVDEVSKYFPFTHDVPTVSRRHVVLYHKRLRKALDEDGITLKYFTCAEYGSLSRRPHYHEILFLDGNNLNLPRFDIEYFKRVIASTWSFGSIDVGVPNSYGAINYTSKYMRKRCFVPIGADPVFRLMSKGIGLRGSNRLIRDIQNPSIDAQCFFPSGVKTSIPRYYRIKAGYKHDLLDDVETWKKRCIQEYDEYKSYILRHNLDDNSQNRLDFHYKIYPSICSSISDTLTNSSNKKSLNIEKL